MSRRELSLPPLLVRVTLRGVVGQKFAHLPLAARETLRGVVSLHMPILARNGMGKMSIMLRLGLF